MQQKENTGLIIFHLIIFPDLFPLSLLTNTPSVELVFNLIRKSCGKELEHLLK